MTIPFSGVPLHELGPLVRQIDEAGYDSVWSAESTDLVVVFGRHVVGNVTRWRHEGRVRGGLGGRCGVAEAAGAAVGRILPRVGQAGDHRRATVADDQGEPGR